MATFKIAPHHVKPGGAAVCVFDDDGHFVATVCWRDGHLLVISKYFDGVVVDEKEPPVVLVKLKQERQ
jgi:hypothetical protein